MKGYRSSSQAEVVKLGFRFGSTPLAVFYSALDDLLYVHPYS